MKENVIHLATEKVVTLGPACQLLSCDEPGSQSSCDVEHPQRGDEGRQFEADS